MDAVLVKIFAVALTFSQLSTEPEPRTFFDPAVDQQHVIDDGVGNAAGPKRNPQSTTRPTLTEWHQGQCREDGAVALTADPARGPQRQSFDAAWPADRVIRGQPPAQRHPHEAGDIDAQPIEDVVQP